MCVGVLGVELAHHHQAGHDDAAGAHASKLPSRCQLRELLQLQYMRVVENG